MCKKFLKKQLHKRCKYECTINVITEPLRHKITLDRLTCHQDHSINHPINTKDGMDEQIMVKENYPPLIIPMLI